MTRRWKIMIAVAGLVVAGAAFWWSSSDRARAELKATQRSLRQQGFKVEPRDFDLSLSPELQRRAAALGVTTRAVLTNPARADLTVRDAPTLLQPVDTDAAQVVWRQENLWNSRNQNGWLSLRQALATHQTRWEAIRQAALEGPIRFEPIGGVGPSALLPYLSDLKNDQVGCGVAAILALRDGAPQAAWTNLLAATCLATAYEPEPIDISCLVRFACIGQAYDLTWNVLQAQGWTDAQLADLQRRWKAVDLWRGLPETAAYTRVSMAQAWEEERRQSLEAALILREIWQRPKYAWSSLQALWRRYQYRVHYSYVDEQALLLHYRDRELELRQAVSAPSWRAMRALPGVTNLVSFVSPSRQASPAQCLMNLRQMSLAFQGRGGSLLGRAAEAEARRRLIITALALERYRIRLGAYPQNLAQLVPQEIEASPVDFMDGQPLRYRLTGDNHFVLYSIGLDGVDNGGDNRGALRLRPAGGELPGPDLLPDGDMLPDQARQAFGFGKGTDLVWPRPASEFEVQQQQETARRARARRQE
jgi:hypothetical protein